MSSLTHTILQSLINFLHRFRIVFYTILANSVLVIAVAASLLYIKAETGSILGTIYQDPNQITYAQLKLYRQEHQLTVHTFNTKTLDVPAGYEVAGVEGVPFIKVTPVEGEEGVSARIFITPRKFDSGDYQFAIRPEDMTHPERSIFYLKVEAKEFDKKALRSDLQELLGNRIDHYGIYIYDLQREQSFGINHEKTFPPASIAKLPVAILTLRDVDAGLITLESTYPIQNRLKHSSIFPLEDLQEGTNVTIREYLERLILESSNTAWYHLRDRLGGTYEGVNPRTINELKANGFFEDPHIGRADKVGRVLKDVYDRVTLSEESANYLLNLMFNAPPDLKLAIPGGVPDGVKVANKAGFLFGGREGSTYADAGIVYGPRTDYVLVVLNDQAPPYPNGAYIIADISKIVYSHLQK